MNCVFQDDEIDNEFFNILKSEYHFEDLDIDDKVMNTLDKAMEQYGNAKRVMQSESNQWSQIENNFEVNSDNDLAELNQDIKKMSLIEDNVIDANLIIDDTLTIKERFFNAPVDPSTKITNNSTSKLDDTNSADKLKIENNEESKTEKQNNKKIIS